MEPPVVRPRGRPRKRRKEDDIANQKSGPEMKKQAVGTRSIALVGRYVLKEFEGSGIFLGKVVYYEYGLYRVNYEDGDSEDLESGEIRGILLSDNDFDHELSERRKKLDEYLQNNSSKITNGLKKGSVEKTTGVDTGEACLLIEPNGGLSIEEDVQVEGDVDSSSDSCEGSKERNSEFDAETIPVPPLQLPPSSGTLGVPEQYVPHLLAVYGFLRSFSICLFLSPFSLDDFVGSLNCGVSNTLLDAIHVSLMHMLRRHLETLLSEGSELASKCLRYSDWSLLDTLTWPVYVVQYLTVRGYAKGPEWKGFCDEIFNREYYSLRVGRKLLILQILCDDVLDSAELRTELDMREVSEVGVDYDTESILSPENRTRRVHPRYMKTSACKDREALKIIADSAKVKLPGNSNISDFNDIQGNMEAGVDRNGDECQLCGMDGTLLCCDGCPSAYHSRCIGVMKMFIPEGPWYCPECKTNMTCPRIARGTSLRGAETFGKDISGQIFLGTCDHLLVLKASTSGKYCVRYYNQNDIPKVLQVLYSSSHYTTIYSDICKEILQYWNFQEWLLSFSEVTPTNIDLSSTKEHAQLAGLSLAPSGKDNQKLNKVEVENISATTDVTNNDKMMSSLKTSSSATQMDLSAPESHGDTSTHECSTMDIKLSERNIMAKAMSTGSVGHRSLIDRSSAVGLAKSTSIDSYSTLAHNTCLPVNLSSQTRGNHSSRKTDNSLIDDFVYMGPSYKPQSYINYYMHGDFSASAAAKLAALSTEDSRISDFHVPDYFLQAKAFSLTASRFFWPSSEKKLVEVPRERCGWCLACKAPISSKKGCMLNHAALSATKGTLKILAGLGPVSNCEGHLSSIATYIIYMEETLHGLIVGPFLSASYRKQWHKQVEKVTTFNDIKPLLLELEENIRIIALSGDWVKLVDDWFVKPGVVQNVACSVGAPQKRGPSGKRNRKQTAIDEVMFDSDNEKSFSWWRGGKFSKILFQKAILPRYMIGKAARQGGLRKISGVSYTDGSEIPRRSRQLVWRASVEMSRNTSQLALQVRCLDFHLRWIDLLRPEQNVQDVKGLETEASAFRNAIIFDKKLMENQILYGVAFGSQKHLPSRVMKNIIVESGPDGKEKYWLSETRIPLYLIKEYEQSMERVPLAEEGFNVLSRLQRRWLKATRKDIFFYLTCKRDNLDMCSCSVCQLGVLIGNAVKCNACQGFCHKDCSISSTTSTNEEVEFLITCKQCYHANLLVQNETSNLSPTSPLLMQGPEHSSATVTKGPKPKCNQALKATRNQDTWSGRKQDASDSSLVAKSRRRPCSWGIIWRKKNNENTGIDFRLNNILLRGGSEEQQLKPVCLLCQKPYRPHLMYICCETCKNWYHADAVELEESKLFDVIGFKCCKCRRIKSPVCPYSELKQEGKKTRMRSLKQEHTGLDSYAGTISEMKECEPATPMYPVEDVSRQDDDPLLFSLSKVELITEPKADIEWNSAPGPGKKLPVRRHVKREGDDDFLSGSKHSYDNLPKHCVTDLSKHADNNAPNAEDDSTLCCDSNALNDCDTVSYEFMEFEPHTYFSVTELLQADDSDQFNGMDTSGDVSEYLDSSFSVPQKGVPQECGAVSLHDKSGPANSVEDLQCWRCSEKKPTPDLSCNNCGLWIHSECSPWVESSIEEGRWSCGHCRKWR
ncbi:DDT domain-containing protein PTM [Quillaja saponaria]|uniref:DDT domain-containing protein PTM n=1 Tax=Quillaja saponaria TaxID=32244 RepID=A0AAD7PAP7_QUISA|nr:DDT domain-containing protein PTM [Quillaja saponaria]